MFVDGDRVQLPDGRCGTIRRPDTRTTLVDLDDGTSTYPHGAFVESTGPFVRSCTACGSPFRTSEPSEMDPICPNCLPRVRAIRSQYRDALDREAERLEAVWANPPLPKPGVHLAGPPQGRDQYCARCGALLASARIRGEMPPVGVPTRLYEPGDLIQRGEGWQAITMVATEATCENQHR